MNEEDAPESAELVRTERFLATMSDLPSLLATIISEACLATGAESCSVALYDEPSDELYFYVARGTEHERDFEKSLKCLRMEMGEGLVGWCAKHRELVNIRDAYCDPRFSVAADEKTGFATRTILAVPMVWRGKLVGVVEAVNKQTPGGFTLEDERVLLGLARQAALVLENSRLMSENMRQARLSALGEGIAGAAHCIKNILSGITGGAYVLEVGIKRGDLAGIQKGWVITKKNSQLLNDLVLDMLSYSKPREPEYATTCPNELCNQVAALLNCKAKDKGVEIVLDLKPDLGLVNLDPNGIYRCLLNLAGNAIDACGDHDGRVRIATQMPPERSCLLITVSDNGCGISPEDLKKLFGAFFSTKGSKGTGLGLAVTQKIIQEHRGTIEVESHLHVGTTFTIRLPHQSQHAPAPAE